MAGTRSSTARAQPSSSKQRAAATTSTAATASSSSTSSTGPGKKSKVKPKVGDAMGYMDAVKAQFIRRPEVYQQFLDLMNGFKKTRTDRIDTPGVVNRIVQMFKGYPQLINDFNLFLPDGYALDCTEMERDGVVVHTIEVTLPTGTTTTTFVPSPAMFASPASPSAPAPTPGRSYASRAPASSTPITPTNVSPHWQVYSSATFAPPAAVSSPPVATTGVSASREIKFFGAVKDEFRADPYAYGLVLGLFGDFYSGKLDVTTLQSRGAYLLKGHTELMNQLNALLAAEFVPRPAAQPAAQPVVRARASQPVGLASTLRQNMSRPPPPPSTPAVSLSREYASSSATPANKQPDPTAQFVNKIKTQFPWETYQRFLDVLADFYVHKELGGETEVIEKIKCLFPNPADSALIAEFAGILEQNR